MQASSFLEKLTDLVKKEKQSGIDSITVNDIPLWRLVRQRVRSSYFKKQNLFVNNTSNRKLPITDIVVNTLISTLGVTKLLISRDKDINNVFFTFGRTIKLDGAYLCKFTDPIIEINKLDSSSIVFEKPLYGSHRKPRYYSERVYYTDVIDYASIVLGYVVAPLMYLKHKHKYIELSNTIQSIYTNYGYSAYRISVAHSSFLISYNIYKIIFSSIGKPKRTFVLSREIFKPITYTANRLGMTTYELQHGVTESETVLYSGVYNQNLDTDYFLSFGDISENNYFSIPNENLINIGFAYKSFIADKIQSSKSTKSSLKVLCISTPNSTKDIVDILVDTAKRHPAINFLLRLHPQEGLTPHQTTLIEKIDNIDIDNNTFESMLRCAEHDKIIGAYSSVLYEAASLNKPVAVINFKDTEIPQTQLLRLTSSSDIDNFLTNGDDYLSNTKMMYSDFNYKIFKEDILND